MDMNELLEGYAAVYSDTSFTLIDGTLTADASDLRVPPGVVHQGILLNIAGDPQQRLYRLTRTNRDSEGDTLAWHYTEVSNTGEPALTIYND